MTLLELSKAWSKRGSHVARVDAGDQERIYLDISNANGALELDFSEAGDLGTVSTLRLVISARPSLQLTLVNAPREIRLELTISAESNLDLLIKSAGVVEIVDTSPIRLTSVAGVESLVIGKDARVTVSAPDARVHLAGGHLSIADAHVAVDFEGGELSVGQRGHVRELRVIGKQSMTISTGQVRYQRVTGADDDSALKVQSVERGVRRGGLTADEVIGLALEIESKSEVCVRSSASDLRLSGKGTLRFDQNAVGEKVDFEGGSLTLACGESATLVDITGRFRLGSCQGAQIGAAPSGYEITGRGENVDAQAWEGSILTGFRMPEGLTGRHLLGGLGDAYHLDPNTTALPGWEQSFSANANPRSWFRWAQTFRTRDDRSTRQRAEYMRELARLARDKGAPGSTRTKIGWCANRLRNQGATGVERLALSGYRFLGYGERPMPALATWLIAALACTVVALSCSSISDFWPTFGDMALGPLAGIMRVSGTASELVGTHWLVVRALIAAPLITGLIALRNYVKGG